MRDLDIRAFALGAAAVIAVLLLWPADDPPRAPEPPAPAVTAPRATSPPRSGQAAPWYPDQGTRGNAAGPQGPGSYSGSPYGGYSFRGDDRGGGGNRPYPYQDPPRFRFRPGVQQDTREQRFSGGFVPPGAASVPGYANRTDGSRGAGDGAYGSPYPSGGYAAYGLGEGSYGVPAAPRQPWDLPAYELPGLSPSWQEPGYGADSARPWDVPAYAPGPAPSRDSPEYRPGPLQPWENPGSGYPSPYSGTPDLELFSVR
jgi:hypothetical protein